MNYLFGFPVGIYKIDPNNYDKEKIVSDIIYNYKTDPTRNEGVRNEWDNSGSKIHSDLDGKANDNFKKINYSSLIPLYNEKIKEYLSNFKVIEDYNYKFKIINYTCSSSGQYMQRHIHTKCAFNAVHYVKFNKKEHMGTTFHNRNSYVDFLPNLREKFYEIKSENDITNSWAMENWTFNVEEDEICFSPAVLQHSVSQPKGDDLRITIAMNIDISEE